jgi:hypothetical protein
VAADAPIRPAPRPQPAELGPSPTQQLAKVKLRFDFTLPLVLQVSNQIFGEHRQPRLRSTRRAYRWYLSDHVRNASEIASFRLEAGRRS